MLISWGNMDVCGRGGGGSYSWKEQLPAGEKPVKSHQEEAGKNILVCSFLSWCFSWGEREKRKRMEEGERGGKRSRGDEEEEQKKEREKKRV